jgi:ribonuclease VapC
MVIDSSALLAILFDEAENSAFTRAIGADEVRLMSAMTMLEASILTLSRRGEAGVLRLDRMVSEMAIDIVPFDREQMLAAREAFARFGKGRHRAGLNFGDCAAYALAIFEAEPLLFKGTDFGATDVQVVVV